MDREDLVDYFIQRTDERFDHLDAKMDEFTKFKAFLLGSSFTISAVTSTLIAFATIYFLSK